MNNKKLIKSGGFTLIELICVIAILSIIASIMTMYMFRYIKISNTAKLSNDCSVISDAIDNYEALTPIGGIITNDMSDTINNENVQILKNILVDLSGTSYGIIGANATIKNVPKSLKKPDGTYAKLTVTQIRKIGKKEANIDMDSYGYLNKIDVDEDGNTVPSSVVVFN